MQGGNKPLIHFDVTEAKARALVQRMQACGVAEGDLQESFSCSSGPGGQHVNKTATCVRLVHLPSGLTVKMQKGRSQGVNRYYARKRLCELLEEKQLGQDSPQARKIARIRKQKDRRRRRRSAGQ